MKKLFYSLFTAVTMLLAVTSCSQEEDFAQSSNQMTSFSISLDDKTGSRAVGEGGNINVLYYEVFLGATSVHAGEADFTNLKKVNVDLPLLNGETYSIIFWAQDKDCAIYKVKSSDNKPKLDKITVDYSATTLLANQDSYDAFYNALIDFQADGNTHKVVLRRPFAQLNLGTSDWETVKNAYNNTDPVAKTKVEVTGLANTFYPLQGLAEAEGDADVKAKFDYSEIPNGTFSVTKNEENGAEPTTVNYQYLSLNYLLVPGEKAPNGIGEYTPETSSAEKATVDLKFYLKNKDDKELQPIAVSYAPVLRNWRTNIIGNVLTGTEFDIEFNPDTDDEVNWVIAKVDSPDGIEEAIRDAEEGTPIYLEVTNNITFGTESKALSRATDNKTSYIYIPENKNVVLDLKGFTISGTDNVTGSFSLIKNQGTLTITNSGEQAGKLEFEATNNRGWSAYSSVVSNTVGGNLIVESDVVIEHKGGTDMAYGIDNLTNGKGTVAVTTVNGATVKSSYRAIRQFLNGIEATNELYVKSGTIEGTNKSIWMQDPSANANTGKLVVEAAAQLKGDVYLTVTAGSAEWPVEVSIAAAALAEGSEVTANDNLPVGYSVKEVDDVYTVVVNHVAKIGEVGYTTLKKAVDAVEDGGTITLVADETFTENNRCANGTTYWDGLGYSGDKSFTIDLGGKTIDQDGALNDYLMFFKNDGAKDNTITLKNGTLDAGATAYCALATASSNAKKITINLENISLVNNNSNGSVVKIRGGSVLNVNDGTKITGTDSYLGIECIAATVNVYEGAEIEMKGETSYNGCLIGVGGYGTINVYDGSGKGAKGGLIAMNSGGTINVSGGEWVANTNGTYANDNNSVLVAQSNGGVKSVINVTGGTFRGGYNCYGDAVGDSKINIEGGNFNSDPSSYLGFGCYANANSDNTWTVEQVLKEVEENTYEISSVAGLKVVGNAVNNGTNYFEGATIKLGADIDLNNEEWTPIGSAAKDHGFMGNFDGNGYVIKNLKISYIKADEYGYVYAGLFGVTEGKNAENENYIKNLTIENVSISTEGHIVSAAIAYPYYTTLENITVKGNVNIKGGDYTAGVLAYTRRLVNAKNITIEGSEGSVIEGATTVGGVISDIQMNGELTANYTNFAASGLTIKGTKCVGGISGIIAAQKLDGATVKNVTIDCNDRAGIISGAYGGEYELANVSYEDVTGATEQVGGAYDSKE